MKERFVNPHVKEIKRTLKDVLLWQLGYYKDPKERLFAPDDFTYPTPARTFDSQAPTLTWINHCTFLVRIGGTHILTDPIWSERCSPVPFFGPKRMNLPGMDFSALPNIDYVMISHNHYDHLDKRTVRALHRLFPGIVWFVPTGVKQWFLKQGITAVLELGWWEESKINPARSLSFKATAVPAQHFSGRKGGDLNRTLWVGWVLEFFSPDGLYKRLYFSGDTGYNSVDFRAIGELFGPMDLSLIPIGAYLPKAFMQPVHASPEEAVRIHCDVQSKFSVAMHWKTFRLSDEKMHQPPYDLFHALERQGIAPEKFCVIEPGHEINW